jgi:hypothetical protein
MGILIYTSPPNFKKAQSTVVKKQQCFFFVFFFTLIYYLPAHLSKNRIMTKILLVLFLLIHCENPLADNYGDSRPTIKLSPQVRIIEREKLVTTIPIGKIHQLLNQPRLITETEIENAGYIIGNADRSILLTKGREFYATGLYKNTPGNKYIIVRVGKTYRNPKADGGDVLGHEAIYLGEAIVEKSTDPVTLKLTKANREIMAGDLLLPQTDKGDIYKDFYPHSPKYLEDAYIIAVVNDNLVIGSNQIVIINKGSEDGIERGHILAINKLGKPIFDPIWNEKVMLPPRNAGTILIFRAFERVSYALVIKAHLQIKLFDSVALP